MTNDILEQIVDDYFRDLGYFTQHNVPYRPDDFKSMHSDIDVIAINPRKKGLERVVVISCKSWQSGFDIDGLIRDLKERPSVVINGKTREKLFREIAMPKWSKALIDEVKKRTGQKKFIFYIAVTHIKKGEREKWENFPQFKRNLPGCKIKLVTLIEMIKFLQSKLVKHPNHSELGRLLQLIKASGLLIS